MRIQDETMTLRLILVSVLACSTIVAGQNDEPDKLEQISKACHGATNCDDCMKMDNNCAWCLTPSANYFRGVYRCDVTQYHTDNNCQDMFQLSNIKVNMYYPPEQNVSIGEPIRMPYASGTMLNSISPHSVSIRLGPGSSVSPSFKIKRGGETETEHYKPPITKNVTLLITNEDGMTIRPTSTCNNKHSKRPTMVCPDVGLHDILQFELDVTIDDDYCVKVPSTLADQRATVMVSTYELSQYRQGFNLVITVDCRCPCNIRENAEFNSLSCNNRGNLICGKCLRCQDGTTGDQCEECKDPMIPYLSHEDMISGCVDQRRPNTYCNGKGMCRCGRCECNNNLIGGNYCECDNGSCMRHNGKVCNGRGRCDCGSCTCTDGYSGPGCQCPGNDDDCRLYKQGEVCGGRGVCRCGKCQCEFPNIGKYCELCENCPSPTATKTTTKTKTKTTTTTRRTAWGPTIMHTLPVLGRAITVTSPTPSTSSSAIPSSVHTAEQQKTPDPSKKDNDNSNANKLILLPSVILLSLFVSNLNSIPISL